MPATDLDADNFALTTTASSTATTPDFNTVGVELEYPIGDRSVQDGPSLYADTSHDMRNMDWDVHVDGVEPTGRAGRDHVGAEVRSPVFDLHTSQPEEWYTKSILWGEENGYNFAANGYGATNFGLHMHLSQLSDEQRDFIDEISRERWIIPFVCSSISTTTADPWRHGGVNSRALVEGEDSRTTIPGANVGNNLRHSSRHFEWRLPEPMMPDHYSMVMHFLRLVSLGELDRAYDYAYERVHDADPRLTAVQQYEYAKENVENWLDTVYRNDIENTSRTRRDRVRREAATLMFEIMGDA
jgi:hypothetical protein